MPNSTRMNWPWPSENQAPWYDAFEDLIASQDASGYAAREDRNLIISEGGTISWTLGTSTLQWTAPVKITSTIMGHQLQIAAAALVLDDGEAVYVNLVRAPTQGSTLSPAVVTQIPSSDTALLFAIRIGNKIYFRNGQRLADGEAFSGLGAGQGGGGGGGGETLQETYELGQSIVATSAFGGVSFASDGTLTQDLLKLNNLGSGAALRVQRGGADMAEFAADGTVTIQSQNAKDLNLSATATTDLNLAARGQSTPLNETGNLSLAGGFSAASIIGALNELLSGSSGGQAFTQTLDGKTTGTLWSHVGSLWIKTGTLKAASKVFAGVTTAGPDAIEVELRRETDSALIGTWNVTGFLAGDALAADVAIPADDWYNLRIRGSGPAVVSMIKGIDFLIT